MEAHLHRVLRARGAERLPAGEEHIHEHAKAPPVHGAVVPVSKDILGRDVAWGATERVCAVALIEDLGKAKVTELGVAVVVDEDVLGLEVAVHNVALVQVLQGQNDAGNVEPRQGLLHALHPALPLRVCDCARLLCRTEVCAGQTAPGHVVPTTSTARLPPQ